MSAPMRRTRIKICGITCGDAARAAVEAGADAIGFVFAEGTPRAIEFSQALAIAASLPPFVAPVAVFRNRPVDQVARWPRALIQLHGEEDERYIDHLLTAAAGPPCASPPSDPQAVTPFRPQPIERIVIRGFAFDAEMLERWAQCASVHAVLVDGPSAGSGESFDHERLARMMKGFSKPLILAGGLTAENVGDAVRAVRPYAVDVSSGVESSPGVKDPARIRAFCDAVRAVDEVA